MIKAFSTLILLCLLSFGCLKGAQFFWNKTLLSSPHFSSPSFDSKKSCFELSLLTLNNKDLNSKCLPIIHLDKLDKTQLHEEKLASYHQPPFVWIKADTKLKIDHISKFGEKILKTQEQLPKSTFILSHYPSDKYDEVKKNLPQVRLAATGAHLDRFIYFAQMGFITPLKGDLGLADDRQKRLLLDIFSKFTSLNSKLLFFYKSGETFKKL